MDDTEGLEEKVRQLARTVETLRSRLAQVEQETNGKMNATAPSNRREFLRLGGAAALGAVGAVALRAAPASAADNGTFTLGQANLAAVPTTIQGDTEAGPVGPPTPVLAAMDSAFTSIPVGNSAISGPLQGRGPGTIAVPVSSEGVDGWAGGALGFGVYGLTDAGVGVVGESTTGIGLYARRSGRILQDGLARAGNPGYSPNLFEQVRDANGVLWIHNPTGVWRRVNSVRVDTATGSGAAFKPFRRLDTRSGAIKAPGSLTVVSIAGQGSGASAIPADAIAAVGNLTATAYSGAGFLAIMPAGLTIGTGAGQYNPAADPSSLNFQTGQVAIANAFICGLSGGALQVYVGGHTSHFIVDITAYIQ
jgi:hypothetical protein